MPPVMSSATPISMPRIKSIVSDIVGSSTRAISSATVGDNTGGTIIRAVRFQPLGINMPYASINTASPSVPE